MPEAQRQATAQFGEALSRLDLHEAKDALQDIADLAVWNKIMRVEDAVWDSLRKRALFAGLGVKRPRILSRLFYNVMADWMNHGYRE